MAKTKISGLDEPISSTTNKETAKVNNVKTEEQVITRSFRIYPSLHKKIKFLAIEKGLKDYEVLNDALNFYFDNIKE